MGQPSALFLKVPMSRGSFVMWLASKPGGVHDFDDWRDMNPTMASHFDELAPSFYEFGHKTVSELIDAAGDRSEYFCCEYDDEAASVVVADVSQDPGLPEIAVALAALRGVSDFADGNEPGFIYVYPVLSGGDPEALMRVERGSSKFLRFGDSSPEVLYFLSDAEEFIEALLEPDD